jgi:HK97 family phage portal protein
MDLPARAASAWYARAWLAVSRALGVVEQPDAHDAGADYSPAVAAGPTYPAIDSMSAMAGLPWVYACVQARAEDMAGLPLRVSRRGSRGRSSIVEDHPLSALLAAPTSWQTGEEWRRQLYADMDLSGNAFALLVYSGREVASLPRLHPERVVVHPGRHGGPESYEYQGAGVTERYAPSAVLHVRGISWESDPRGLWGTSRVLPLHHDLEGEVASSKHVARAASSGRPDVLLSPRGESSLLSSTQVDKLREWWDKFTGRRNGGAIISPGHVEVSPLSWSPRDMEYGQLSKSNREKVLAVFGVTPVRVGLNEANYATAREQATRYWEGLAATARAWDARLTWLAARAGYPDVEVWHDFGGVAALRDGMAAQLDRVERWVMLGADPREAAAYEGLPDAPLPAAPATPATPPKPAEALTADWWGKDWHEDEPGDLSSEPDRASESGYYVRAIHRPGEARMATAARRYFDGAGARASNRLARAMERRGITRDMGAVTRDVLDDLVAEVLAVAEEYAIARDQLGPAVRGAMEAGHKYARRHGLPGLSWDPSRPAVARMIDRVVQDCDPYTAAQVRAVIEVGIERGDTVADMQAALQRCAAYRPARALRVARTETTRAVQVGADMAYRQAQDAGLEVEVEWLSARDGEVREAHYLLDGQRVAVGGSFTDQISGKTAPGPGQFSDPALVVNCRCTTVPRVKRPA